MTRCVRLRSHGCRSRFGRRLMVRECNCHRHHVSYRRSIRHRPKEPECTHHRRHASNYHHRSRRLTAAVSRQAGSY